ncbi:MAG: hypothetical protein ABF417_04465 [Bifidobacterium aquikefiri]
MQGSEAWAAAAPSYERQHHCHPERAERVGGMNDNTIVIPSERSESVV